MKHLLSAILQWTVLLVIRTPLILLGFIIVPLALPFSKVQAGTNKYFTEHAKDEEWVLELLPSWAWLWSNGRDGARGDKRGWWHVNSPTKDSRDFLSKLVWLAYRNPVNNLGFLPFFSCDVSKSKIEVIGGSSVSDYKDIVSGWQLIKADDGKFKYYHLYVNYKYLYIRVGHKFKLEHNGYVLDKNDTTKALKSWTLRIRFRGDEV